MGDPLKARAEGNLARARWTANEMQPTGKQTWKQEALFG